jgi:hypothetical protein
VRRDLISLILVKFLFANPNWRAEAESFPNLSASLFGSIVGSFYPLNCESHLVFTSYLFL